MHDDEFDDQLARMLADLPRTVPVMPGQRELVVAQLRREGFFEPRRPALRWMLAAAAAGLIFAVGALAGARYSQRRSLEGQLARRDLTPGERVLLLQRAGSAYVEAAQRYADATSRVDTTAVEVSSSILLGAANAVARSDLDAGLSRALSTALTPVINRKPQIWF